MIVYWCVAPAGTNQESPALRFRVWPSRSSFALSEITYPTVSLPLSSHRRKLVNSAAWKIAEILLPLTLLAFLSYQAGEKTRYSKFAPGRAVGLSLIANP